MRFSDHEELAKRNKLRDQSRRRDIVWNILTAISIISTLILVGGLLLIFANPYTALNPFPPPTMPVLIQAATSTPTQLQMPATWTPTPSLTATIKPPATNTNAPTQEVPTASLTPYPTAGTNGDYPFAMEGKPEPMANIVFHPSSDCRWQGVAGNVVDMQGRHIVGTLLRITGFYNGKTVDMTTLSGGAQAWYGDSGYEFVLSDKPTNSTGTLYIQMVDQSLRPLSDRVIFDTFEECTKNLILINFRQVR